METGDENTVQIRMPKRIECVDSLMAAVLRNKTDAERLAIGHGMWIAARDMLTNLLRSEQPDWTEPQVAREVAKRLSHGSV